jgi:single-strand DNA-binding protein
MTKGLNKVLLIGQVDDEPELRHTPSGRPVASFTVAIPRMWTSADGAQHEEVEWFNVVAWGSLAELCERRLAKGHQVYVEGRLQTRRWQDESGRAVFRTEVVAQELVVLGAGIE